MERGGDIEGQGIFGGERDFHIKVKQCLVEPLHFDPRLRIQLTRYSGYGSGYSIELQL